MSLHEKFDTLNEYQAAIDRVILNAKSSLNIFDFNLADSGYNTPQRIQLLRDFLLTNRNNRLIIILHETDYLSRYCPRMINLLTQFSHTMSVKQTREHVKQIYDTFVLADNRHYVRRFHYDRPCGQMALDDYAGSAPLAQRFGELENASDLAISPTTLGL